MSDIFDSDEIEEDEPSEEGCNIDVRRDSDQEDWYIRVAGADGEILYDGWWRDSADKTRVEAIQEAMKGAQIQP